MARRADILGHQFRDERDWFDVVEPGTFAALSLNFNRKGRKVRKG